MGENGGGGFRRRRSPRAAEERRSSADSRLQGPRARGKRRGSERAAVRNWRSSRGGGASAGNGARRGGAKTQLRRAIAGAVVRYRGLELARSTPYLGAELAA